MSGSQTTTATSGGTSISALPVAQTVAQTDTLLGLVGGNASGVTVATLLEQLLAASGFSTAVDGAAVSATAANAAYQQVLQLAAQIAQITRTFQPIVPNDAMMSAYYAGRPVVDPKVAGAVIGNAGILTVSEAGAGVPTVTLGGLTNAAMNLWLDALPTTDPATAGAWWNNAGVPTLSSAGAGDVSAYNGPLLTDAVWCAWVIGLPTPTPASALPDILAKLWINDAGVAVRT